MRGSMEPGVAWSTVRLDCIAARSRQDRVAEATAAGWLFGYFTLAAASSLALWVARFCVARRRGLAIAAGRRW